MQSQNAISKSLHIWGINRLNLHPFAVHPRLVRKPEVEGRGVRRAERAVVVVRDLDFGLHVYIRCNIIHYYLPTLVSQSHA